MKKFLLIIISALLLFTLSACGASSNETVVVDNAGDFSAGMIYEDDTISVELIEFYVGEDDACYMNLHVDNHTNKRITVYLHDGLVNDEPVELWEHTPMMVEPGKSTEHPFYFEGYEKNSVQKIEFIVCLDDESLENFYKSEPVVLISE